MTKVDLEKLIEMMFPWSAFHHEEIPVAIKAYALGFKDAYAKNADNVTIEIVQRPTAREQIMQKYLYGENDATQQEGTKDKSSDGEVLRKGEGR